MFMIPLVIVAFVLFLYEAFTDRQFVRILIAVVSGLVITVAAVGIDYAVKTTDTEVWSGVIEDWDHEEEWDEWVPPETVCTTDSKGNQSCTTKPGYMIHHPATNRVKTTDDGWKSVSRAPDGRKMDDYWPNTTKELKKLFPEGTATASTHTYTNKVQSSYSLYKHPDIDLDEFKDLPSYPDKVRDTFYIDRLIGSVPKKKQAQITLNEENARLNVMIPAPDKPGKKRSYKQVNLIFVNLGDGTTIDHGYALQDAWEGGNKNDFVVAFSMDKKGDVAWAHPFSWSEVEKLKLDVKGYMESLKGTTDFSSVITDVSAEVENQFKRKEFADFNYLQIELSLATYIIISILLGLVTVAYIFLTKRRQYFR